MNALIHEYENLIHSSRTISNATSHIKPCLTLRLIHSLKTKVPKMISQSFEYLEHISCITLVKILEDGFYCNRDVIF